MKRALSVTSAVLNLKVGQENAGTVVSGIRL